MVLRSTALTSPGVVSASASVYCTHWGDNRSTASTPESGCSTRSGAGQSSSALLLFHVMSAGAGVDVGGGAVGAGVAVGADVGSAVGVDAGWVVSGVADSLGLADA